MATGVAGHGGVDGVHDEVPVVQTAHAPVLPHHGIYGHVCVHQGVLKRWRPSVNYCPSCDLHPNDDLSHLKPAVTFLPRQVEVRYEKGGDHMPHVVVHPACQPQLPHGRIHQRVSCPPSLPGLQVATVSTPPQSLPAPLDKQNLVNYRFFLSIVMADQLFLPYMEVGATPKEDQETMSAASTPNPARLAYVGTLGGDSGRLWHPTITSVGWSDRSEGTGTRSWCLERLPCRTPFHICTHLRQVTQDTAERLLHRWSERCAHERFTVIKEGLQSSVRSSFAEIPGIANVGSPVNLKKIPMASLAARF